MRYTVCSSCTLGVTILEAPTAAFESQDGLGCRTRMQLTAVVLCVSNQSSHEQLGFYRCFRALLDAT